MNRRTFLLAAAIFAAAAVILAVSGGFRTTVGGLRISMRSPMPIAILAVINAAIWFVTARKEQAIAADLEAAWHTFQRRSAFVAGIALASTAVAAVFSTRSAAGADASGYVSQAEMWSHGDWRFLETLQFPGWLTTPLGWRPMEHLDRLVDTQQAPTYPPGLPLLMAIPHALAGIDGATAVVLASSAIAIVATALVASHLAGSAAAVIAAVLLGFTPVFLYQSIQPMSDVPATAAWMTCFLLSYRGRMLKSGVKPRFSTFGSGIACSVAVLIRPNLAPLAIIPLMLAQNRVTFSIPVAVAGAFLAAMQWLWYGSPLRFGYGSAEELFALSNIGANASRYFTWLIATAPVLLLAVFGFHRLKRERFAQGLFAFALLVIASYLAYAVFDEWSYLRFLLPALAVFAIFAAAELAVWIERRPIATRAPMLFVLLLGVAAFGLFTARSLDTFKLADRLRRVSQVADFINRSVPEAAVILSGEQSGAMRYYTHRPILRWEAATAESLQNAVSTLESTGRPVFIVLDAWEDDPFKKKFAGVAAVSLDWPPMLEAGRSHRTRLWKMSDRDRFLRGDPLTIIRLP